MAHTTAPEAPTHIYPGDVLELPERQLEKIVAELRDFVARTPEVTQSLQGIYGRLTGEYPGEHLGKPSNPSAGIQGGYIQQLQSVISDLHAVFADIAATSHAISERV